VLLINAGLELSNLAGRANTRHRPGPVRLTLVFDRTAAQFHQTLQHDQFQESAL